MRVRVRARARFRVRVRARVILEQREDGDLDRCDARVELEHGPLLAAHLVRAVGGGEHRQHQPVDADRRLCSCRVLQVS